MTCILTIHNNIAFLIFVNSFVEISNKMQDNHKRLAIKTGLVENI